MNEIWLLLHSGYSRSNGVGRSSILQGFVIPLTAQITPGGHLLHSPISLSCQFFDHVPWGQALHATPSTSIGPL